MLIRNDIMLNPPSSTPKPGDLIEKCGSCFTWTDDHLSKQEIEPLRQQWDTVGSQSIERIQAIKANVINEQREKGTSLPPTDLYALLRDHHQTDEALSQFWDEVHTVPDWVDWGQIARGQRVFYRYAMANIVGFALQGFMAENSAAAGVIDVLVRTGGFSTRVLLGRLLATFQWLIQVTHDLASIQPGGEGHIVTIRVRLLHSSVRHRILNLCQTSPDYFDAERHGIPVNTLDSIHSISTFCCNPFFLQLPRFGIRPSPSEVEDYIALFRYIGHLLGTPVSNFQTLDQAKKTMESLLVHEVHLTETSKIVSHNFLECVGNLPAPFYVSKSFVHAGSRWINGHAFCDALDLGRPGIAYYGAFAGFCILVTGLAWLQWLVPGMDDLMINLFRAIMYRGIVQRKSRSGYPFKFVPQVGKMTGKEKHHAGGSRGWLRRSLAPDMGLFELFFVSVLLGTVAVLGGCVAGGGVYVREMVGVLVVSGDKFLSSLGSGWGWRFEMI